MRVGLFISCLNDTFFPRTGMAVVGLLEHFGCEVHFPTGQTCCGQPAFNNGLARDAVPLLRNLQRLFAEDDYVVSPSASCAAMIVEHGPHLLDGEDSRLGRQLQALADKTLDIITFLDRVLGVDPEAWLTEVPAGVPLLYHYPCHTRCFASPGEALDRARRLLGPAVAPVERFDQCCGFGGMFAVEHHLISNSMVRDKIDCIGSPAQDGILICDEAGCRLNIEGALHRRGTSIRVRHTAELIAEALALPLPEGP